MPCRNPQVRKLVADILNDPDFKAKYHRPYPEDITDQVAFAIYNDRESNEKGWFLRYRELVTASGKGTINQDLGACVLAETGMFSTGDKKKARCPLISSTYTVLVNDLSDL